MNSMTGFGRGNATGDQLEIVVELTSLNRRNFELSSTFPKEWQSLEYKLSQRIRQTIKRGRVNAVVQVQHFPAGNALSWDEDAVKATLIKMEKLAGKTRVSFKRDARLLFDVTRSHLVRTELPSTEEAWTLIEKALSEALDKLSAMRRDEGVTLAKDLKTRIDIIATLVNEIRSESSKVVPKYRETLMQRLSQAGLELEINDERVLKEIALAADRCDISEEITRLSSHLEQFQTCLHDEELIGRKLEFILQEINREINTVASKANHIEIINRVLNCKNEIERIREQVQNVE